MTIVLLSVGIYCAVESFYVRAVHDTECITHA